MNFKAVKQLLDTNNKFCITAHYRPDGDAIGSSMGLFLLLKELGCENVKVVMPSDFAKNLKWIKEVDKVAIFPKNKEDVKNAIDNADVLFCLDFNEPKRVADLETWIRTSKAKKILIDHHPNPDHDFADHVFSDISYSSTCEMIHHFIINTELENYYTADIANSLYTGILTDTGGFRYATSSRLMKTAAYLLEQGADDTSIINHVFDSNPMEKMLFLGHCLANRMEYLPQLRTAIIYATKNDFYKFKHEAGFTDGIVNQPLSIDNMICSIFVSPGDGFTKLSFRSKGDFAVNAIASEYFNGGGHKNAAGGRSEEDVIATVKKLKSLLPKYKEQLISASR